MRWTGNSGKAKIQRDLMGLPPGTRILDVGAVGPRALDLWRGLDLLQLGFDITAVDPDAEGIEAARQLEMPIRLMVMSGYELTDNFEPEFDLVVSTQVLEHVARPAEFLDQVAKVLRPGGDLWLTVDSGHFSVGRHDDRLLKRVLRPWASKVSERYYDYGVTEEDLVKFLNQAGFEVAELMHCNLGPLKPIYSALSDEDSRVFMPAWIAFEEKLAAEKFSARHLFRGIYAAARMRT